MNLTIDPWIPAIRADGRRDLFSLQDLFAQAHELRDLAVKPHERIALMRLLLCIAQAALDGPEDENAWEQCHSLIQPRVRVYLDKWRGSFDLLGGGPRFLQLPNLKPGKETDTGNAATKLDLALATGNNSTLFYNYAGTPRELRSARSAINLLAFQCFSPGGRIGIARWNGTETAGKGSCNHAPCTPSSMVHTLLLGESLLQTFHLNLLSRETVTDFFGLNRWGQPVWELPVKEAGDRTAVENAIAQPVFITVAALFASHPEETNARNFGETCRRIALGDSKDLPDSFQSRFRRLLASGDVEDVSGQLRSWVRLAASKGVGVNYESLFADLWNWPWYADEIRVKWAKSFWQSGETVTEPPTAAATNA
jgi:CRISPR system Cascade subunit CasA